MFSFFKRNKNKETVPEWANFFTPREYRAFIAAVDHYFQKAGIEIEHRDGVVVAAENPQGFDRLGLLNVAQRCRQEGPNRYQDVVQNHFDTMAKSKSSIPDIDQLAESYDGIKNYLGVRIYPSEQIEMLGTDSILSQKIAEGIHAVMVFDLPEVIINVTPDQADRWDLSFEKIYQKGLQNVRKNCPVEVTKQELGPHELWMAVADHFFTPNMVLDLKDGSEYLGTHGALVAIPNRHVVLIYPIESMEVAKALSDLIPVVQGLYQKGPGSISENIFFFHQGQFINIPFQMQDDKLQIRPPQEFVDVLNRVAGDGGD